MDKAYEKLPRIMTVIEEGASLDRVVEKWISNFCTETYQWWEGTTQSIF